MQAFGADPKIVEDELVKYNAMILEGKDAQFDKPLERSGRKVEALDLKGPLFAMVINPRLNYTPEEFARIYRAEQLR